MSLADQFQTNVRRLRTKKAMSQQVVAEKAGLSVSYVSMLERGERTPPLETVERFAKAFGVRAIEMFQ